MAGKKSLLVLLFVAIVLQKQVLATVGEDCSDTDQSKCTIADEQCVAWKCAARVDCSGVTFCQNGGTCPTAGDHPGKTPCNCLTEYSGDRCETKMSAATTGIDCTGVGVCKNGGKCPARMKTPCMCTPEYEGEMCETKKTTWTTAGVDCTTTGFCKNSGICPTSGSHAYRTPCECPSGYEGDTCETKSANAGNEVSPTSKLLLMTKMFNLTMSFP